MRPTPTRRRVRQPALLLSSIATAVLAVAGCASDPAANTTAPPSMNNTAAPGPRVAPLGTPTPAPAPPNKAAGQSVGPVGSAAPGDAKYTIVCTVFPGPAHVQEARVSKENLVKATGKPDFYVVHDEHQSTLYYGYYRERERSVNAAEADRAAKDKEYIRNLVNGEGYRLFSKSLIMPLPTPDPAAPPEFDITQVDADLDDADPNKRYWTIVIADYSNDVNIDGRNRKQLAVEAVQDARRRGIEAYFYNGPNTSTICIGAWPRSAVRDETEKPETANAEQELIVSSSPLGKNMMDEIAGSNRNMKVVQPKIIVQDRTVMDVFARYKEYSLNGVTELVRSTDPNTNITTKKAKETYLTVIPRKQTSAGFATQTPTQRTPVDEPAGGVVNPLDPTAGRSTGIGALRPAGR